MSIAFLGGLISFLSPCILPIIPGYLAYLAGSITETPGKKGRLQIFLNSIFFVLGFSIVFALLGVLLNSVLQHAAYGVETWLSRVGGTLIIFFGLYLSGLITVPFLDREHKFRFKKRFSSRYITSFVFGAAFAAGWTPCVGAALGAILALAATQPTAAFSLLVAYSLGLGIPFLIVGAFASQSTQIIAKLGPFLRYANVVFGIILIILGILVFTQSLPLIANFQLLNSVLLH